MKGEYECPLKQVAPQSTLWDIRSQTEPSIVEPLEGTSPSLIVTSSCLGFSPMIRIFRSAEIGPSDRGN